MGASEGQGSGGRDPGANPGSVWPLARHFSPLSVFSSVEWGSYSYPGSRVVKGEGMHLAPQGVGTQKWQLVEGAV